MALVFSPVSDMAKVIQLWMVSDINKANIPFSVEIVLMDDQVNSYYYY